MNDDLAILKIGQTILIVLKLIGVIQYSWFWVLSPLWGFIVFTGSIFFLLEILGLG